MEDEGGALLRRQPAETALEGVARRDVLGGVRCRWPLDRQGHDVGRPLGRPLRFRVAGVHQDPMDPGFEPSDSRRPGALSRPSRGFAARRPRHVRHRAGSDARPEQPVSRAAGDRGEGLLVPGPRCLDEARSIHPAPWFARLWGRVTHHEQRACRKVRNSSRGGVPGRISNLRPSA